MEHCHMSIFRSNVRVHARGSCYLARPLRGYGLLETTICFPGATYFPSPFVHIFHVQSPCFWNPAIFDSHRQHFSCHALWDAHRYLQSISQGPRIIRNDSSSLLVYRLRRLHCIYQLADILCWIIFCICLTDCMPIERQNLLAPKIVVRSLWDFYWQMMMNVEQHDTWILIIP